MCLPIAPTICYRYSMVIWSLLFSILTGVDGFLYEDPSADELIRGTMEATYSLQLEQARAGARMLEERYPNHPVGFTLMAETYWWEAQADRGNELVESAYYEAQKVAGKKAEFALEAGEYPRAELLSYMASVHASYARFQVTQKEAFFSAMRAGLRAHRYAKQVYALDPEFYDIYVGLGAFNFFTGSLPGVLKPFAFLIGARGNKETGFEQLGLAREKSRYSRTEARIVSYTALLEDGQYAAAFNLLEGLRADYPGNQVFFIWATDWFLRQGRVLSALNYFDRVVRDESDSRPLIAQYALLEKAGIENAMSRRSAAQATIDRIRQFPGRDPLLVKKLTRLEARLRR